MRISEAFGVLVDDEVDLGDTGLLLVRSQGGRPFRVRGSELLSSGDQVATEADDLLVVAGCLAGVETVSSSLEDDETR